MQQKGMDESVPLGFFMYPVSQAADISVYDANLVPVGEDQVPHIEVTRQLVRKFNGIYGDTLVEPEAKVSQFGRLVGTDNNAKMSKSLNNAIYLSESSEDLKQKIMSMYTDPSRIRATDPGTVEGNPVFIYHDAFNPDTDEVNDLKERYRKGTVGDVEVKQKLLAALETFLAPIRERRSKYDNEDTLMQILRAGTEKGRNTAADVIGRVKDAMKIVRV